VGVITAQFYSTLLSFSTPIKWDISITGWYTSMSVAYSHSPHRPWQWRQSKFVKCLTQVWCGWSPKKIVVLFFSLYTLLPEINTCNLQCNLWGHVNLSSITQITVHPLTEIEITLRKTKIIWWEKKLITRFNFNISVNCKSRQYFEGQWI
jgi:hypothetical protein